MFRCVRAQRGHFSLETMPRTILSQSVLPKTYRYQGGNRYAQRSIFSMSRLPMRTEQKIQQGKIQVVQKVKFQKPGAKFKHLFISLCISFICYRIYCQVVLGPLDEIAAEALKEIPDEGDEEDEEEDRGIFIPFPGTTKMLKPIPYRGSDPEWQEFVKFSKDPALGKSIREELAQYVRGLAERHPVLRMRCGKGIQLRRYWLDIDYPPVPPPEYERSGIEIMDDYIAWTTMPVDSLLVHRIREVLWPTAMLKSTWSFTKTLLIEDGKRLASFFGYEAKSPITIEQLITQQQQQRMQKQLPSKDGPVVEAHSAGDGGRALGKVSTLNRPNSAGKASEALDSSDEGSILDITAPISAHFFHAMMAFKMTLAKSWKPVDNWPPRGSILVGGLVELDAPKAWLVFDVRAAWDPQTRQYDPRSMVVSLRRLRPKKQSPISGI